MNKAASRNIKGIDFDAQAAARDAARREGKSLGEWLHGVIAEHAVESGVSAGDVAGLQRVEAVTSRLERLSSHAPFAPGRASRDGSSLPRSAERLSDARLDEGAPTVPQYGWRGASQVEDSDALLEEAIEQMDRRAARSERRAEEALDTVAKMIETGEARRARESEAVCALTEKLATLETKLTQQSAPADNPVKGALARLEARLELIGKRNDAEAEARAKAVVERPASDGADAVRRLEDKLNSILRAVEVRPASPPTVAGVSNRPPLASRPPEKPAARRSLGEAIAEISHRQKMLDDPASPGRQARARLLESSAQSGDIARQPRRAPEPRSFDPGSVKPAIRDVPLGAENGIANLINRVDDIRRDLAASREMRQATRAGDWDFAGRDDAAMPPRPQQELGSRSPVISVEASLQDLAARLDRPIERDRESGFTKSVAPGDIAMRRQIGALEKDVRDLAETVDSLRSAGVDRTTADMLQAQMKELAESALALRAMITTAPGALALEKIEQRLERLAGKVDAALIQASRDVSPPEPKLDTSVIEGLVRELGHKIEAAQAPRADTYAIESLQNQVEQLSERFARSEQGLSTLPTLAASVRELFNQLEATRASVETSAAHAAREVLRIAADDGRNRPAAANTPHEVNASKTLQKDADQRVQSTLNTVHAMLEKVVDRLNSVEHDIADVRRQPASAVPLPGTAEPPVAQRPSAPKLAKHPEPAKSSDLGFGGLETARDPIVLLNGKRIEAGKPVEPDESARHNDFIAAARRAAKTVQAEPTFAALKRPPATSAAVKASRADILAKSRDYVATHKRPMLMGMAAILMVLGTIAVLQRTALGSGQEVVADDAQSRAVIARPSEARLATSGTSLASAELSPSALPQAAAPLADAIPGSDPVQTGSIPSLPAFAAQASVSRPARQGLPPGLMIAAEAGNGDAQYDLGTRYIDGRAVPRDMKLAAQWLEKAANQGLAPARYRLASLYEKGIGVAQDKAKARSLYTSAADAGNPRAMHNLAVMLADGDGHPDYAGAAMWFRKAASFGIHDSQYNLAILLARGLGVQQSLVQSYQWFAVAASKNDADAARKRDEVGAKMTSNDLAVAKALAAAFQPKTANASVLEIDPPPGGWDSAPSSSRLNSAKSKVSSL